MLATADVNWMQSLFDDHKSAKTDKNQSIKVVFEGNFDNVRCRDLLSTLKGTSNAKTALWLAKKNIANSIGDLLDVLREGVSKR